MKIPRMNFNAGEISPLLNWRSDLGKYSAALKQQQNFLTMSQGGLKRRPGTSVLARVADVGEHSAIKQKIWEVDRDNYFTLIFAGNEIVVYNKAGALVDRVTGTPWGDSELSRLYFQQIYDVMYIAHPSHPLKRLERTDTFVWGLADAKMNGGPFEDDNDIQADTLTGTWGGSSMSIVSSGSLFVAGDVGRGIRAISQLTGHLNGDYDDASVGTFSDSLAANGSVTLRTEGGIWEGALDLQESLDGGATWETIGSISSIKGKHNGELSRDVSKFGSLVRVLMASRTTAPSDTGCIWYLDIEGPQYIYMKITSYTSPTQVTCSLESGVGENFASWRWALGSFGGVNGYPGCIEIHEERLMLGGAPGDASTIYGSAINAWDDFVAGTLATSAIKFTLSSDTRNDINWFAPEQSLIMGTESGEWTIGSRSGDQVLSGENVGAKRHTQIGSDNVQPVAAADRTLYIEAGGKRLRGIVYSYEQDKNLSDDMSILADHLTKDNKLIDLAFSRSPDQIIWVLRDDGLLLAFAYQAEHQISAWSRHPMSDGGKVLGVNSILQTDGDEVVLLVERNEGVYLETINQKDLSLDWLKHHTNITATDFISMPGAESFEIRGEDLAIAESKKGTGSFIRLINSPVNLVIKYDGAHVDAADYSLGEAGLIWLPNAADKGLIEVLDFITPLVMNTDYKVDQSDELFVLTITNPSIDISTLVLTNLAIGQVVDEDYWIMDSARQVFIFNAAAIVDLGISFSDEDYSIRTPSMLIRPEATDFYTGIKMTSLFETVDVFNHPDIGAGTRNRITEIEIFIVGGVGGELSVNQGEKFVPILFIQKDVIAGERLPEFTGKKEIRIAQGYQTEGTITFKNESPYPQTIAAIGVIAERASN